MKCRICDSSTGNKTYEVREMMLGLRDRFTYFQCSRCGCLQIADIPSDMTRFYPPSYYSFSIASTQEIGNPIVKLIRNYRNKYAVLRRGLLGKSIANFFRNETLQMLSLINLREESAILDVGCGRGAFLYDLREIGFSNLLGIDPYITQDILYKNGLRILKRSINEIDGNWDLIMFHHSFEHMSDPLETLRAASELLLENGTCLIRVPTVSSYAWEHYRENWVQLDAPRHFFLHSIESIRLLAEKARLDLERVLYDSYDMQFWGSEQYVRDIASTDPDAYHGLHTHRPLFSKKEMATFKEKAKELNAINQGDQCAFFLRKSK